MATIRAFTTIEQSRKLAEILPLESADMRYEYSPMERDDIQEPIMGFSISSMNYYRDINSIKYLPCWSLTALFGVLPTIDDEFEPQLHRSLDKYRCTYEGEEDSSGLWRVADNPVDACYEMILMLHKLNLL